MIEIAQYASFYFGGFRAKGGSAGALQPDKYFICTRAGHGALAFTSVFLPLFINENPKITALLWDIFKLFFPLFLSSPHLPTAYSGEGSWLPMEKAARHFLGMGPSPALNTHFVFFPLVVWVSCGDSSQCHITRVPQPVVRAAANVTCGAWGRQPGYRGSR